ncbi:MAG: CerR family C-terminal domain-containing protein [Deltaproteobacteria bacterium]|nr:CerR family C-terminal domain-containing protein [Deltaproteobacteria bacterium]
MAGKVKDLNGKTRASLLHMAGEVFAEGGFHAATVRDICRRARVNAASINYHFGSKGELYAAVLEYSYAQTLPEFPGALKDRSGPPGERLSLFIRGFMQSVLDEGRPAWYGKLMAREMVEPTSALDRIVDKAIRPRHKFLRELVVELLGYRPADEELSRMAFSIIGQCLFYYHARQVIARLNPSVRYDTRGIGRAAAHIALFSLSALKAISRGKKGG